MFKFGLPSLKNYERLFDQIYAMVLEPFYRSTNNEGVDHLTEDQKNAMKQALSSDKLKKRLVDFKSVKQ